MSAIEIVLLSLLALWGLGSVLFLFRIPRLHLWFRRWNRSRWLVHWSLFSPSDPKLRPGMFELRFRDRGDGGVTPWCVGATGHCWSWRAGLWQPERLLASAVQNLGRDILALSRREPPAQAAVEKQAAILLRYLRRRHPLPAGAVRECQLARYFASDGTREAVLQFTDSQHGVRF